MKNINRILVIIILTISIIIGIIPSVRSTILYYILYAIIVLIMLIYICTKAKNKDFKINLYSVIVFLCLMFRHIL